MRYIPRKLADVLTGAARHQERTRVEPIRPLHPLRFYNAELHEVLQLLRRNLEDGARLFQFEHLPGQHSNSLLLSKY